MLHPARLRRALLCAAALLAPLGAARAQDSVTLAARPPYLAQAQDLGAADPAQIIDVTIWLAPHDRAGMDRLARDLYDPSSPRYRHFLTHAQFAARFAPTAAEAALVAQFFAAHRLQPIMTGGNNFFVRARGRIEDVQNAFAVSLHTVSIHGQTRRAAFGNAVIAGPAARVAGAIVGLDSGAYVHHLSLRESGALLPGPQAAHPVTASDPGFFSAQCFTAGAVSLTTNNAGALPAGHYTGNMLHLETPSSAGCGYTPAPLAAAYGMQKLFAEGFTGKGQTIAIIDWCGSSTIQSDTNAFSRRFNLPLLDSSNFSIVYTPGPSTCVAENQVEINLDVEWAHAFAPGAAIALIVPPSANFQDVDEGFFYAVNNAVGLSISGSYGSPEDETPAAVLQTENLIAEMAAITGISAQFSSGDSGDFAAGSPQTVNAPANSPYATGVGGTSLALTKTGGIAWQTGWGTNITLLAENGGIFDPPAPQGFRFGAGGGRSSCATQDASGNCLAGFPKPSFQNSLPGKTRLVPDIGWLADPYTGAVIAITVPNQSPALTWETVGGTSLAAPLFSALWAIANEEAGAPLGQAAPSLYAMRPGAIADIVPFSSPHNVTATIREPGAVNSYNAGQTIGGGTTTQAPGAFVSALWNPGGVPGLYAAIAFGTDCIVAQGFLGTACTDRHALHTATGWDDVTGLGAPMGKPFADQFRSSSVSPE